MKCTPQKLLNANFPLCFENGHTVDTVAFWCIKCGMIAHESQVQGQVSRIVPETADIWATYQCSCGHSNSYRIRLKDDKSFTWLADGSWQEKMPEKRSAVTVIEHWYRTIIGFLKFKWGCFLLLRNLKKLHRIVHKPQK